MSQPDSPDERYRIEVTAVAEHIAPQSRPEDDHYVFAYHITIRNTGREPAQLLTRHWIITDGNSEVEEVRGPGVVGEQPVLAPGESFRYTSGCPLTTDVGKMEGSYQMVTQSGEPFDVEIAPFTLCAPGTVH